jgi:hypothetical protein
MAVIEILYGEKIVVEESLKRRVSKIFGKTENERVAIRKKIDELYEFRSDLVHGKKIGKQIYEGHLREARIYARKSLLWFITFLSIIHEDLKEKQIPFDKYPDRRELLILLDNIDLERLGLVIQSLPPEFPNIKIFGN